MNNLQQCEQYRDLIQEKVDNYILSLGLVVPDKFYGVNYKEVVLIEFDQITYFERGSKRIPELGKRPSAKLKGDVKFIYDEFMAKELQEENIRIHMRVVEGKFKSSWADDITTYKSKNYSTSKIDVQKILDIEIEDHNKIYLAKEGQFNCSYCGKAADDSKKIMKEIIYRTRNEWGRACVGRKTQPYCSSRCGCHDQMAHEG